MNNDLPPENIMSNHRYHGTIKLSGMPEFEFATTAASEGKARSNGLAQFARKLNMSIPALSSHLKRTTHKIAVNLEGT